MKNTRRQNGIRRYRRSPQQDRQRRAHLHFDCRNRRRQPNAVPIRIDTAKPGAEEVASRTVELEASRQRFEDFAAASPERFWETDAQHRFIYISDSNKNMLPRADDILGKTQWEAADRSWCKRALAGTYRRLVRTPPLPRFRLFRQVCKRWPALLLR